MPKVPYLLAPGACLAFLTAGDGWHAQRRLTKRSLDEVLSIAVRNNPILR
jgi:hypothetical protein